MQWLLWPLPSRRLIMPILKDNILLQAWQGALSVLRRSIFPNLLAGMGMFVLCAFTLYRSFSFLVDKWPIMGTCWLLLLLGLYGSIVFLYFFVVAWVFAVKEACVQWDELIDSLVDAVKENLASHLDSLDDNLAKEQAKILVRGSIREVFAEFKQVQVSTIHKYILRVFIGILTLVLRSVLIAKIVKFSGTTIKISKLFASKALLTGAIFLNLRLFTTILLWFLYFVAIVASVGIVWLNI